MRPNNRENHQSRPIKITRNYTKHAEGSVLVEFGDTKVLCTASVDESVPRFLKGQNQGWVTAEYGMLPRSTHSRMQREAAKGKQGGRTMEIQRLIARSLRAMVDLEALGERSITLDCDVIHADGGTRTASITGAAVALCDAINGLIANGTLKTNPIKGLVAAISVGIVEGEAVCDLEYVEDSAAETDMNVVMMEDGRMIEVQGTAEGEPFSHEELLTLLGLAKQGCEQIFAAQREAAKGKQGGRTMEIQRLIARSLRAMVDLEALGERSITLDCDVIQADGGTRTASITGAAVALCDAINGLITNGTLKTNPIKGLVAAISVGIVEGEAVCDLEYVEDSAAETDMNVVMMEDGRMIEVQGTAEGEPFSHEELLTLLGLAKQGCEQIFAAQREALGL